MSNLTEITATFHKAFVTFGDGDGQNGEPRTIIGSASFSNGHAPPVETLAPNTLNQYGEFRIKGRDDDCGLLPGLEYRIFGRWGEHPKHGPQFEFRQFVKSEPHSRHGLIHYLRRYAPGIGPALSGRLFDRYGSDAVLILRTEPERAAAEIHGLRIDIAKDAAAALVPLAEFEETKIELTDLLAGRGFPHKLVDQCIKAFGILAPQRIKRDPFTLLVRGFSGCGFNRCDRLYMELGNDPTRLKRQMICAWHALKSDSSGNTWFPIRTAVDAIVRNVGGVGELRVKRALRLGQRSGWLRMRNDGPGGKGGAWWVAEGRSGWNERVLAMCIGELMR